MAIEIIGENQTLVKECSCGNCAARLRYTLADRQQRMTSDYTGDRELQFYLVCPRCRHEIVVARC